MENRVYMKRVCPVLFEIDIWGEIIFELTLSGELHQLR